MAAARSGGAAAVRLLLAHGATLAGTKLHLRDRADIVALDLDAR